MAKKVIIDTDCGVDDAAALLMALESEQCQVLAITCVAGNTTLSNVIRNVATVLELAGKADLPIFVGAAKPLLGPHRPPDWPGHGADGLGNFSLEAGFAAPKLVPQTEHAVTALVRLINAHPGEIHVITLGPLTNLALAVAMDPSIAKKVASVVSMAGTHTGQGNSNCIAEFNVLADPEAAAMVFQASFVKFTLVTWCLTLDLAHSWDFYTAHIAPAASKYAAFIYRITQPLRELKTTDEFRAGSEPLFNLCDTTTIVVFLHPEAIQESKFVYGVVETGGSHSRGGTFFDFHGYVKNTVPNVTVITKFDRQAYVCEWNKLLAPTPSK